MTSAPLQLRIVYMGDSITVGQYIDPMLRWSQLVSDRLEAKWSPRGVVLHGITKAISGETTRMALERYPADVQQLAPQVLTIQFGMNDCNCWLTDNGVPRVSPAAFRANLHEMIERARRFGTRHIILATNHPTLRTKPMISGETYEAASARYSQIIREVAREAGTELCDIREAFSRFGEQELDRLLRPLPDHLHLSVEGNAVYAGVIFPYLDAAIAKLLP